MELEPALLTAVFVLAVLVVRIAVGELREPGRGRADWEFLKDRQALVAGAAVALVSCVLGWWYAGGQGLVWGALAGVLVAYATGARGRSG
ncbi:hypothetical protein [Streptomyces sp. NPDC059650]|uniref:hypothetical protein n=1 Tax=Streptomyces sp. NPDC059650 TaxID=3346896 RepID=UPI0036AF5729